jgi:hypothetical protein
MQLRIVWCFLGLAEDRLAWLDVESNRTGIRDQLLTVGLLSATHWQSLQAISSRCGPNSKKRIRRKATY